MSGAFILPWLGQQKHISTVTRSRQAGNTAGIAGSDVDREKRGQLMTPESRCSTLASIIPLERAPQQLIKSHDWIEASSIRAAENPLHCQAACCQSLR